MKAALERGLEQRVRIWRDRIVRDAASMGVHAEINGDAVLLSARALETRWMADRELREIGRNGR